METDDDTNSYLFTATPEKSYVFKVSALTNTGTTPESELSDPIMTKTKKWGNKFLQGIPTATDPPIYQLPLQYTTKRAKAIIGKFPSKLDAAVTNKVLMVVGATGAGKSTLIDSVANYIMGVDWEDDFRFKLIPEDTALDQVESQTQCITAYTFQNDEDSPLPYNLTVVDTPGFGGLERDRQLVEQIKELFSLPGDEGIDQLHEIGFVTQASQPRLTQTQQYVFDSILSVFGKDVADNIFLMVTSAELNAARAACVPFKDYFKFNNSALFTSNLANDKLYKMFWKIGKKSFEDFFDHFSKLKTCSLQLSSEEMKEREQHQVTFQGLQPQIREMLTKIKELQRERQVLKEHEADNIIANTDFTFCIEVTSTRRKIDLSPGRYTTNCLECNCTCHDGCTHSNENKFKCAAMNKQYEQDATCRVCPGKCSWREHVCNPYKFEIYQETETRTSNELKDKYGLSKSTTTDKLKGAEAVITERITESSQNVLLLIKQTIEDLQRLGGHHIDIEYIDYLIDKEKKKERPSVAALEVVRKQAACEISSRKQKVDDDLRHKMLESGEQLLPLVKAILLPQPDKPYAISVTSNSIRLAWSQPGHASESVQYNKVWYRSYQSDQWNSQSTADTRESALLTGLDPRTFYHVKVQAVSSTRTSPDSEISDLIETLSSPPGKLLELEWKKPANAATEVLYANRFI